MDDRLLEQEKAAAADMKRPWALAAFIGLWPAVMVLALMQMHCVPFPSLHVIYLIAAIVGGLACIALKLAALRRHGGKMMVRKELKAVTPGFAIGNILASTLAVSFASFLASYVLLGDLVLLSSHARHDYDATVMGMWSGPRKKCKNEVGIVEETLQIGVSECARDKDVVAKGSQVHVQTLVGPLGVRILSVHAPVQQ